jgi:hypothetical protein
VVQTIPSDGSGKIQVVKSKKKNSSPVVEVPLKNVTVFTPIPDPYVPPKPLPASLRPNEVKFVKSSGKDGSHIFKVQSEESTDVISEALKDEIEPPVDADQKLESNQVGKRLGKKKERKSQSNGPNHAVAIQSLSEKPKEKQLPKKVHSEVPVSVDNIADQLESLKLTQDLKRQQTRAPRDQPSSQFLLKEPKRKKMPPKMTSEHVEHIDAELESLHLIDDHKNEKKNQDPESTTLKESKITIDGQIFVIVKTIAKESHTPLTKEEKKIAKKARQKEKRRLKKLEAKGQLSGPEKCFDAHSSSSKEDEWVDIPGDTFQKEKDASVFKKKAPKREEPINEWSEYMEPEKNTHFKKRKPQFKKWEGGGHSNEIFSQTSRLSTQESKIDHIELGNSSHVSCIRNAGQRTD